MRTRGNLGRIWLGLLLIAVAGLVGCMIPIPTVQPLTTIEPVSEVQDVGLDGAQRAKIRLRLLSNQLVVRSAGDVALLRGEFHYNVKEWAPNIKQATEGDTTDVTVSQGMGSQIPLGKTDEYINEWTIDLAPGVPLDLGIDMGAGNADLDLTGLSLTKLLMTSGDTDLTLAFNAPNPVPLSALRLTTGAGKVVATGLGNANFDVLTILGGTGSLDLDFHGAFQRAAIVDLKAGAGKITIRVPPDLGVRVTFTGTPVGKVDVTGFSEQEPHVYVNDAYGKALLTLTVKVTAGVSAITLISQ